MGLYQIMREYTDTGNSEHIVFDGHIIYVR